MFQFQKNVRRLVQHKSQDTILLQSAVVYITAGSKRCQELLLFDSRFQCTFMSLNSTVQLFRKEELLVSPFGLDEENKAEFQLKKVCLVAEEEEIVIEALVSPVISPPIHNHLRDDDLDFCEGFFCQTQ